MNTTTDTTQPVLQDAINTVLKEMNESTPGTDKYSVLVDQLDKLHKMKAYTPENRVNLDTLVGVAGNLFGILTILNFERTHVVASKALSFVLKSKV